jgi:hypothetical protein
VPSPWRRRVLLAVIAVVVLTFGVWLAWTVYEQSTPSVTSELESFEIVDDHTVTAVLAVALDSSDVKASCTLRAYAEDHTIVGELGFTPDASLGRRQVQTIRTDRRATSVESLGCTAPGQDQAR